MLSFLSHVEVSLEESYPLLFLVLGLKRGMSMCNDFGQETPFKPKPWGKAWFFQREFRKP